jgi:hypothetical protein
MKKLLFYTIPLAMVFSVGSMGAANACYTVSGGGTQSGTNCEVPSGPWCNPGDIEVPPATVVMHSNGKTCTVTITCCKPVPPVPPVPVPPEAILETEPRLHLK